MRKAITENSSTVPDETWATSSFCNSGTCVEIQISQGEDSVRVRDSKQPEAGMLQFSHEEWRAFVAGVRNAEFDI